MQQGFGVEFGLQGLGETQAQEAASEHGFGRVGRGGAHGLKRVTTRGVVTMKSNGLVHSRLSAGGEPKLSEAGAMGEAIGGHFL